MHSAVQMMQCGVYRLNLYLPIKYIHDENKALKAKEVCSYFFVR